MSATSWTLAAIALISLLAMTVAAVVEGSAGMITRERFRQTTQPRERTLQAFLDPRRSLVAALHLAQVVAVAVAASALTVMTLREPWLDPVVMVEALKSGKLGGAGLDVFVDEPRVPPALLDLENVVLLPHVASATVETRGKMGDLVIGNLANHFAGKPLLTRVP